MRRAAALASALLLQACAAFAGPKVTVITGATLVNSNGDVALANAVVVVRGSRIAEVGKAGAVRIPRGATVVDATGQWLIPGLIDGHVHFFQSGGLYTRPDGLDLRWRVPYAAERERIRARLDDTFARYLRSGITAVADVGGPRWNFAVRERARATALAPRVAVAGPLVSTIGRPELELDDPPIVQTKSPEEAVALVRRLAADRPDFVKIWYPVPQGATVEQYYPIVSAAAAEAHRLGLRVAIHATELAVAKAAVRAGADILVHSVFDAEVDDEFIALLKQRNVLYTPTIVVYEGYGEIASQQLAFGAAELRWADPHVLGSLFDLRHLPRDKLPPGLARRMEDPAPVPVQEIALRNLKRLHDAGIAIVAGTDAGNPGTLPGPSLYREFEWMAQAGLSPQQILVAATRNGARLMGMEKDLGVIEKGRLADLVLLDADPLADIRNVARIRSVMKDGVLYAAETIVKETPEDLVQRQVNAYNARNIGAFLETYAPDAKLSWYPDRLRMEGAGAMRESYGRKFAESPRLHAEIRSRMTAGAYVIDDERVTGLPDGQILEAIAIYEVADGLIRKVWFMPR